jgi:hypothetical protein
MRMLAVLAVTVTPGSCHHVLLEIPPASREPPHLDGRRRPAHMREWVTDARELREVDDATLILIGVSRAGVQGKPTSGPNVQA